MAETPNDKPKNPNIQRPAQPSNNKASEQQLDKLAVGLGELNKTLKEILGNDKNNTKGVKKSVDKNTEEITKTIKDSTKQTAEEKKEGKDENKKFLSTLTGMFDGIKKSLSGVTSGINLKPLLAVWTFFKKLGKLALLFGVGGILANVKLEDIKKIWEGMKNVFGKMKTFFTPIIKELAIWFDDNFLPNTVTLFTKTLTSLGTLFDDLTKDFEGWTKKDKWGKFESFTAALGSLGGFFGRMAKDLLDYFGKLFGYESKTGSITTDLGKWFDDVFSKDFMDGVKSLLATLVGAMVILNIAGVPKATFLRMTGLILWKPIIALFRLIAFALSPVGLGITAAGLAYVYRDEIIDAMDSSLLSFANMFISIKNKIANSAEGKILGLGQTDLITQEKVNKKAHDFQVLKGQTAEKTIARLGTKKDLSPLDHIELYKANLHKGQVERDLPRILERMKSTKPSIQKSVSSMDNFKGIIGPLIGNIKRREDFREYSYKDNGPQKANTIGYGFNLDKPNAAGSLKSAGIEASVEDLIAGNARITKEQADNLMRIELPNFKKNAINWLGVTHWNNLAQNQKNALIDMSYNMGGNFTAAGNWPKLKQAIIEGDRFGISSEIIGTDYASQVGDRAMENTFALMNPQFSSPQNEQGKRLGENTWTTSWGDGSTNTYVISSDSSVSNSESNMISSGGRAQPLNDSYSNKTSLN
jgi:GH24 family phage-related lysozyme (muramidase)